MWPVQGRGILEIGGVLEIARMKSNQRSKASKAKAQNSVGTGGPPVGYGTRQTTARSPPQLGRAAHLQRDPRGWIYQGLLSGRPDEVGTQVLPFFEPFGLSSRSCCSTGRLMRSLSPIGGGGGRSEASPFFHCENTVHNSNFSPGWGGGRGQDRMARRQRRGPTSTPGPRHSLQ
jgi:hypothetical protein